MEEKAFQKVRAARFERNVKWKILRGRKKIKPLILVAMHNVLRTDLKAVGSDGQLSTGGKKKMNKIKGQNLVPSDITTAKPLRTNPTAVGADGWLSTGGNSERSIPVVCRILIYCIFYC